MQQREKAIWTSKTRCQVKEFSPLFYVWEDASLSVQFRSVRSHSVSDSLRHHGLQHARLPCPSPAPGVHSNSCPLSWWCHPTISSSLIPFSSCLWSFPASGSFQMSQFFVSGGQSIGVSVTTSVLTMNIQDWFPLRWIGWISLQSKGLKHLLQHHSSKASILWHRTFFIVQFSHPYMTTGKTIALTRQTFVGKVISLPFIILSRLIITLASGLTEFIPFIAPQLSGANPVSSVTLLLTFPPASCIQGMIAYPESPCQSGSIRWITVFGALTHTWRPEIAGGCDISCWLTWQEIFSFHNDNLLIKFQKNGEGRLMHWYGLSESLNEYSRINREWDCWNVYKYW